MKFNQISDKIFTIEDFLSEKECQNLIYLSEKLGYEAAKLDIGKVVSEVRNNERVFYENSELAAQFWEKLKDFVPPKIGNSLAIGLNELFRFYKYYQGDYFKKHQDGNFIRNQLEASYLTFMIYLNDDCKGGETTFLEHNIQPKQGMALFFYHKLIHEGSEVLEGVKYVLRSDIMYRLEG